MDKIELSKPTNRLSQASKNAIPSGIRKMFEKADHYDNTINMSLGEPGFVTPQSIIESGVSHLRAGKTKYVSNAGIKSFRDAISKKLLNENAIETDPDKNIIVTAGATQALMLTMTTIVDPGDEVILPDPAWPDYLGQIQMVNGVPVNAKLNEENEFKMTADVIEPLISEDTKLIILNSPSNPTGAILNEEELKEIADLVKKHDIFIVSDEPYEKMIYDGKKHFSIGSLEEVKHQVITINSFSKSYAMTGWRVGYAAANEMIISNMIKLHENMIACINEAFQEAAITALEEADEEVENMRLYYKNNRQIIVDGLNNTKGFSCLTPPGAFYVFPNIKDFNRSSEEVADLILEETGVITAPGNAFGNGGEGYLRISYANDTESVIEAVERLQETFGTKE